MTALVSIIRFVFGPRRRAGAGTRTLAGPFDLQRLMLHDLRRLD